MEKNDYRINAYKKVQKFEPTRLDKDFNEVSPKKENDVNPKEKGFIKVPLEKTTNSTNNQQKTNTTEKIDPVRPISEMMDRIGMVKVPISESKNGKESIYRRVAKFLLLIGVDEAAKILPHLTQEQIDKIVPEIASIRSVDPDEAMVILAEFQNLVQKARQSGGVDTARTILTKAFGEEKADSMIQKTVSFPDGKPFEYLNEIDVDRILLLLKDEGVPLKAMILSYIKPEIAAKVINALQPEEKKEVIFKLAKMDKLSPDVIRRVDRAMHEKMQSINTENAQTMDGRGALAQILKKMSHGTEESILNALKASDPELSKDLQKRLFTLEDIINSDDKAIQIKLQNMEDLDIAFLIVGKEQEFRDKILKNISKVRGDIILEEEELRKPFKKVDCDQVTDDFVAYFRNEYEQGRLFVKDSDDIYVE